MMGSIIGSAMFRVSIGTKQDVVLARQQARRIAEGLGFSRFDQARIVAAVSELTRRAFLYSRRGEISFSVASGLPPVLRITIGDLDPDEVNQAFDPRKPSAPGNGGNNGGNGTLASACRLFDHSTIVSSGRGVAVRIEKTLPVHRTPPMREEMARIVNSVLADASADTFDELQQQNRELLRVVEELRESNARNEQLANELEETNRGVVALYSELEENARQLRHLNETLEQRVAERTAVARQQADQLRVLASELTEAEQRERRRLAQVLHDHLQQLLVATKMHVNLLTRRLPDETMQPSMDQIRELLDQSIEASRSLTVELSPPILYDGGLAKALEWLARWMQEKHGLAIEVDADGRAEPEEKEVRIVLFEIVRELLFNVVKHAGVDRADVKMKPLDTERVEIVVTDRGVGFEPADIDGHGSSASGFGLSSVMRRLELLGGHLTVNSSPGRGTCMMLAAPTRRPHSSREDSTSSARLPSRGRREALEPAGSAHRSNQPSPDEAASVDHPASSGETASGGARNIRILLADDHKIVRQGLASLLREQGDLEVVGEASDGQTAVDLTRQLQPDVVVMDVNMPGVNGLAATHHITTEMPRVRVIVLSFHEDEGMAHAMREAGAATYLTKGGPTKDLIDAIRARRPQAR